MVRSQQRELKVAIYNSIPLLGQPDLKNLSIILESLFEEMYQDIDITINYTLDPYSESAVGSILGDGYAVLEIDTMLLGTYVNNGWFQEIPSDFIENWSFVNASLTASIVNNTFYAVPTWTCGNYIYSRSNMDAYRGGFAPLSKFLTSLGKPVALNADLQGSWTLGLLYTDSYIDTYGPESISKAFQFPLDSNVLSYLQQLSLLCVNTTDQDPQLSTDNQGTSENQCLNIFHNDGQLFIDEYAQGSVSASMSFGEFLSEYILAGLIMDQEHPQYIISAPLGLNSHPMIYVDAQAININCTGQCLADSLQWISFFHSVNITSLIALAQDIPDRKSFRYLAPSISEFYLQEAVATDPIYPQVLAMIEKAIAFPPTGYPEVHLQMRSIICEVLGNC